MLADAIKATLTYYCVKAYDSGFKLDDESTAVLDVYLPRLLIRSTRIYPGSFNPGKESTEVLESLMLGNPADEIRWAARALESCSAG